MKCEDENLDIFYLYYLRRPDKIDPIEPEFWQPFYAGRGCNSRMTTHRREAKRCWKDPSLPRDIKVNIIIKLWEQGLDFIEEKILVGLTNDEANEYEREFIAAYGRINNGTGCLANLNDGGDGNCGWIPSEETRKLWSEQRSGEGAWNWGLHWPEEFCLMIGDIHRGKVVSEETRKKQSDAKIGTHHSEETRKK